MARIQNLDRLQANLTARVRAAAQSAKTSAVVGFTAAYAIYVHENTQAYHPVGQAKFLEQPARQLAPEIGDMIGQAMRRGVPLETALLMAGLRLQREAQLLTPVDTGNLRGSAFTRLERG